MRINFSGSPVLRRIVGQYTWDAGNGHVVEVGEAALIGELLTSPGESFRVAADEPLLALASPEMCLEFSQAGIASLADLATLDKRGITALAAQLGQSEINIKRLVRQAQTLTNKQEVSDELR